MAFQVTSRTVEGVEVFDLEGALDSRTSGDLEDALIAFLRDSEGSILINCQKLEYVSSAGLRVLHMVRQRLKAEGQGRLIALCSLNQDVAEVIEISGMSSRFTVHATANDAIQWLGSASEGERFTTLALDILKAGGGAGAAHAMGGSSHAGSEVLDLAAKVLESQ